MSYNEKIEPPFLRIRFGKKMVEEGTETLLLVCRSRWRFVVYGTAATGATAANVAIAAAAIFE